jgi:hypothetical protein
MKAAIMKKARKKKLTTKKAGKSAQSKPASAVGAQGQISGGMVDKQPQAKDQAAVLQAMFLHADDAWAQQYFDQNDLHFLEREVFG